MLFTLEQITRLAPDDASLKAAKGLASPGHWPTLGGGEAALWGECKGSGAKPYQVQMDAAGPAFRCSCPSRKFPCKHGLALLLLHTAQPQSFAAGPPPAWVEEWLASRRQKQESQAQKKSQDAAPPDPQAAAKREAKRLERMSAGAEELQRWLLDQTRQGLANLRGGGVDWRGLAARMVDAQAPGLGRRVQALESLAASDEDWAGRLLGAMGQLQLLLDGWQRRAELSPPRQADLRTAMGWPQDKDDVLQTGEHLAEPWEALGLAVEENDKLWERRVWLRGATSGRRALLLDFAHGHPVFEPLFSIGATYQMTLAFYPGAWPRRAVAVAPPRLVANAFSSRPASLDAEFSLVADALAANPWATLWPVWLGETRLVFEQGAWLALIPPDSQLLLQITDDDAWALAALGGGRALTLFGEWDGERLRPLSAWAERLLWTAGGPH